MSALAQLRWVGTVSALLLSAVAGQQMLHASATVQPNAAVELDIRTFGARCNGGDDSAAVQKALDALPNGGTLLVPCRAGIGASGIRVSDKTGIVVKGVNGGGFLAVGVPQWRELFRLQRCNSCRIEDLVIEINNRTTAALGIYDGNNTTVQNNTISNLMWPAQAAIIATGNRSNRYVGNNISNAGISYNPDGSINDATRGIWIGNEGPSYYEDNVQVLDNRFHNIGGTAIVVHGSNAVISGNVGTKLTWSGVKVCAQATATGTSRIENNQFTGTGGKVSGGGIQVAQNRGTREQLIIKGNVIEDTDDSAVYSARGDFHGQIVNNIFRNNRYAAITFVGPVDGVLVQGNQIYNTKSGTWHGIRILADPGLVMRNIRIESNYIWNVGENGIHAQTSGGGRIENLQIAGNSITDTGWYGVYLTELSGPALMNASVSGCFANVSRGSLYDNRPGRVLPAPAVSGSCPKPGGGDTTAPSVNISSPGNGSAVSGVVTLSASATDNVGVAGVQFRLNGTALGSEVTKAPYNLTWNTTTVPNGVYQITAEARDAAGNRKTSSAVSVTVANAVADTTPPSVSITAPAANSTVSGQINVSANASDNVGVVGVQFLLNGSTLGAEKNSPPYSISWDTRTVSNGKHQLTAIARDAAGNRRTSAAVQVTVSNSSSGAFEPILVNAGGGAYKDPSGNTWAADHGSTGGNVFENRVSIANTNIPALYQILRWADPSLTYRFEVPNGTYNVTLRFAELYHNDPNRRVFNVDINGIRALSNFDIVAAAGGPRRAVDRTIPVEVANGRITIDMRAVADCPQVNAIEIRQKGSPQPDPGTPPDAVAIRVNAGAGALTDAQGNTWVADTGYLNGESSHGSDSVSNTDNPNLYRTLRWNRGPLDYRYQVPNGTYTVRLKFAEMYHHSPNMRVFHVNINGSRVLSNFDIIAAAGGSRRAVDRVFTVTVTGGQIHLNFTATVDFPQVNAIEILQQGVETPAPPPPDPKTLIRVNAGASSITDNSGHTWAADTGFLNGQAFHGSGTVGNTDNPEIYRTLRWSPGPLDYRFNMPNGTYTVRLKFAEMFHGSPNMRVFHVNANGQRVLSNFDIVAAAGGNRRAVDRVFTVNVTNGQLHLNFVATADCPQVNAIEIVQ